MYNASDSDGNALHPMLLFIIEQMMKFFRKWGISKIQLVKVVEIYQYK